MGTQGSDGGRTIPSKVAGLSSSHTIEKDVKTEKGHLGSQDPYRTAGLSTYHDGRDSATSTSTPH